MRRSYEIVFSSGFISMSRPIRATGFFKETATDLLLNRIHQAADEFERTQRDLENARKPAAGSSLRVWMKGKPRLKKRLSRSCGSCKAGRIA